MFKLYFFVFLGLGMLLGTSLNAQKFNFSVGMNMGASRLSHQTRFETTTLRNLYETIELTHREGYEWEKFASDFQLRESFTQPRFGFFVRASHRNLPILLIGEAMSSTSSYEKMAYSVTLGFGQEFYILNENIYCSFLGGYKLIWDKGFGANTLVNSIGHKDARSLVATYFAPVKPRVQIWATFLCCAEAWGKQWIETANGQWVQMCTANWTSRRVSSGSRA